MEPLSTPGNRQITAASCRRQDWLWTAGKIWLLLVRAVITGPVNLLRSERGEGGESIRRFILSASGLEPKSPWMLPASRVHLLGETVLAALPSDVLLIIPHSCLPLCIPVLTLPGFNLHRHPLLSGSYPAAGLSGPPPCWQGPTTDNVSRGRP